MDAKNDSPYRWMRSLKPENNVTVDFIHLGVGELNLPDDSTEKLIEIFAFPAPLTGRPK
jgi:hypothetical protein